MSYLFIENFSSGVDTRRSRFTLPAGALYVGRNVHLTRGGELEVRKAFVETLNLAGMNTIGLFADSNGLLTFGSLATPAGLPNGIQYQRLVDPDGGTLTKIRDATLFNGKTYVIAEFNNGNVVMFYDGAVITAFFDGLVKTNTAAGMRTYLKDAVDASELVTRYGFTTSVNVDTSFNIVGPATQDFTVTGRSIDTASGVTGNYTETSGIGGDLEVARLTTAGQPTTAVPATARLQVTGTGGAGSGVSAITVNAVNLLNATVAWAGSVSATASAIVTSINAKTGTTGYSATSVDNLVTISAPAADGATANGRTVTITTDANVAITKLSDFAGGVTSVTATSTSYKVTVKSTIEAVKALTLFVNYDGDDYRFGAQQIAGVRPTSCATLKGKVYLTAGTIKYFSALNDPLNYEDDLETAGFINMANEFSGADELVGLGVYQSNLATFARRQVFIYYVDADPSLNRQLQVLNNTGAVAEGSIVSVGDLDSFYWSDTGVRSLRARDSSNYAAVSDIGNPIDNLLVEAIRSLDEDEYSAAKAIIEPVDGRYMLIVGDVIYNFTSFPASKVAAWTTYETEFTPIALASLANRVYVRGDDDKVYLYGGDDNNTYEAMDCEVILPHLDAKSPALEKQFTGMDAALQGLWEIYISTNTQQPDRYEKVMSWDKLTYDLGRIPMDARGTHISVKLKHTVAGYARIGNVAIHYTGDETN